LCFADPPAVWFWVLLSREGATAPVASGPQATLDGADQRVYLAMSWIGAP